MKVALEKEYKARYTIEDLERAKQVISFEKDNDDCSVKEWAEMAIREALKRKSDSIEEVLKAEAHTARNCRAWNAYGDDTQDMDVWVEASAETTFGFVKVGAYLSDIWMTGAEDYREHMYIKYARA